MAWDEDDDGVDHCLAYLEARLPAEGVVLDLGCGVGRLTAPLQTKTRRMVGFDTSPEMITHAQPGPEYTSEWTDDFNAAFSVAVFQHIPDHQAVEYIYRVAPRPFVFQFVEGTEREPLSMQRPVKWVAEWVRNAGYTSVEIDGDDRFPNWRWVYAR